MATREIVKAKGDWGLCLFYAVYNALNGEERARFVADSTPDSLHAGFWRAADPEHNAGTGYDCDDMYRYLDRLKKQGWIRHFDWYEVGIAEKSRNRTFQTPESCGKTGPITMSTLLRGNKFKAGTVLIVLSYAIASDMRDDMHKALRRAADECKAEGRVSSSEVERAKLKGFHVKCHRKTYQGHFPAPGQKRMRKNSEKCPRHAVGIRFMRRSEVRALLSSGQDAETQDSQEGGLERADKVVPVLFDSGRNVAAVLTVDTWAERISGMDAVWYLKLKL